MKQSELQRLFLVGLISTTSLLLIGAAKAPGKGTRNSKVTAPRKTVLAAKPIGAPEYAPKATDWECTIDRETPGGLIFTNKSPTSNIEAFALTRNPQDLSEILLYVAYRKQNDLELSLAFNELSLAPFYHESLTFQKIPFGSYSRDDEDKLKVILSMYEIWQTHEKTIREKVLFSSSPTN